jgi:hypothetical protein
LSVFCGISVVADQRLAILDDPPLRGIGEALRPLLEDRGELRSLRGVLIVQRMEKVILLRAGNELLEHRVAIRGEREFFDEADFVFRA